MTGGIPEISYVTMRFFRYKFNAEHTKISYEIYSILLPVRTVTAAVKPY
jgi:hypothetical protein